LIIAALTAASAGSGVVKPRAKEIPFVAITATSATIPLKAIYSPLINA
jgi:hypothetical protein